MDSPYSDWWREEYDLLAKKYAQSRAARGIVEQCHGGARPPPLVAKKKIPFRIPFFAGGGGGIRTPVGLHPNGFQDRLVMTASIHLRDEKIISQLKNICKLYWISEEKSPRQLTPKRLDAARRYSVFAAKRAHPYKTASL